MPGVWTDGSGSGDKASEETDSCVEGPGMLPSPTTLESFIHWTDVCGELAKSGLCGGVRITLLAPPLRCRTRGDPAGPGAGSLDQLHEDLLAVPSLRPGPESG